MGTNLNGIINAGGLNTSDGKILSPSSTISTTFYEVVPLGTETILPYDATEGRLLVSGSALTQTQSIFWVNAEGGGGDGKMYLSDILEKSNTYISGSNKSGSFELIKISKSYAPITNNTTPASDTYVYDIAEFIHSGSRYNYNKVDFTSGDGKLYVYGKDLTTETNTASILLNVSGAGTYALGIIGPIAYASNTSSIQLIDFKGDLTVLTVDGVTVYNTGSIINNTFNTGSYFIFTSASSWNSSSAIAKLGASGSSITDAVYYAEPEIHAYGTGSIIRISNNGSLGIIQRNTEISLGGAKSFILDVEVGAEYTFITTNTYPFSSYYSKHFTPFSASIGYDSYLLGYNLMSKTNQVVVGSYNLTGSNNTRFIIGNGRDETERSNLLETTRTQVSIYGSLFVSNSITSNELIGTASWAQSSSQALTASFVTASNVFGPFGSNSIISASYALNSNTFATSIGNGSATNIGVTHNLNTRDVIVQVYDNASYETVLCDVIRTNVNFITCSFTVAPTTNQYRVVIKP